MFISFMDAYIIIPPLDVEFGVYMRIAEVVDEIRD